jgi:hypothetical protein
LPYNFKSEEMGSEEEFRNGISELERSYCTSLPIATCPGRRNVFTKSPSPQTVIAAKRLNHFPFGTSGSVSSQSANKPSWLAEISRIGCDQASGATEPAEDFAGEF